MNPDLMRAIDYWVGIPLVFLFSLISCNDNLCLKSLSVKDVAALVRSRLEALRPVAAPVGP